MKKGVAANAFSLVAAVRRSCPSRARICRSCKETRYRFSAWRAGTKLYLSYWPARLHRLTKSIPRYRFLGSINVYKYGLWRCGFRTGAVTFVKEKLREGKDRSFFVLFISRGGWLMWTQYVLYSTLSNIHSLIPTLITL